MNPPKPSPILMPCPTHKKLPDLTICGECLRDMGQATELAMQSVAKAPAVIAELIDEGERYFDALHEIAMGVGCSCSVADEAGNLVHVQDCPAKIAQEALSGHESRILHRPQTGQLKVLQNAFQKKHGLVT